MSKKIRERYIDGADRLRTGVDFENQVIAKINRQAKIQPQKKKKIRIVPALIAACIAITAMSTAVFADDIKNYISGMFNKNSELIESSIVYPEIQVDEPWAIIKVEEILADGITYNAIVSVEITDLEKKNWPEDRPGDFTSPTYRPDNFVPHDFIFIEPVIKDDNSLLYGVNYSSGLIELIEYRTENKRFYSVYFFASNNTYGTDTVKINVNLGGKTEVLLESYESIELKEYALDGSLAPTEKLYEPRLVKISPLSLVISGYDRGIVEYSFPEEGGWSAFANPETIDSLYLVFKDGTRQDLLETGLFSLTAGPFDEKVIDIYSTHFENPIDISTVSGIELDGVFYPFE